MSKLPSLKPREIIRALKKHGFVELRQKGSHLIMVNEARHKKTIIPIHAKDIKKGLLYAIINDAGLTPEEFAKLL